MPQDVLEVADHEKDTEITQIGGIETPREFTILERDREELPIVGHRGFGEKTVSQHRLGQELVSVQNEIVGLETSLGAGADTLEIDFARTKDGKLVTAHLTPLQKIDQTQEEYLKEHPEALTAEESFDWLLHQDPEVKLYVEMKSNDIELSELVNNARSAVTKAAEKDKDLPSKVPEAEITERTNKLLERIMVYSTNNDFIPKFLEEKKKLGLTTNHVKLWWISHGLASKETIDSVNEVNKTAGTPESRVYGVEQGMMPLGTEQMLKLQDTFAEDLLGKLGLNIDLDSLKEVVEYAHSLDTKFITGTVDNIEWIRKLIEVIGVDGVVPNNPIDLEMAGIKRPSWEQKLEPARDEEGKTYTPPSVKERVEAANRKRSDYRIHQARTALEEIANN